MNANNPARPSLESQYSLSREHIDRFRAEGHVFLPEVANQDEIAFYRHAINEAADRHGQTNAAPLGQRDIYGQAFLKHMNLWSKDPLVRAFVLGKRFGRIAAELLGVDGVRIYHDQALFKEPGGGFTPWHQDQYYWPVDTDNTVTMWMPLVDLDENMGILKFASRSHEKGYLGTLPISAESEDTFNQYIAEQGMEVNSQKSMKAGDATFHCGWSLHAAPGNNSDQVREVMTVIWVADGCRVTQPINPNQERDITRWMPGLKPGDLVASDLNPIAWKT
jgi:ectoine hydroxylase-related dioxygenase (phytanoyl-CoA dioxygenase family)